MIIFFSCTPAISLEQKEILDMKFVRLEAGIFQMGGAPPIAHPKHSVSLTKPFWISDIEVTQQTYSLLMNENPSLEKDPKKPVSGLLWTEAMAFCNTLSVQEKRTPCYTHISNSGALWSLDCDGFRLPMEDEWEYAAKSGTDWEYAGHPEPKAVGWFRENGQEAHIPRKKNPMHGVYMT
jgi:formylglycine-generating enzyme required for sulfatase activity